MKISDYLKSLGNTSDEVAMSLRAQGIKGKRTSKCHCPVLNGIYRACPDYWSGLEIFGGAPDSKIGSKHHYYATLQDSQIMDPQLPQAVQNFIGDFDLGKYPDMEVSAVKEVTIRTW